MLIPRKGLASTSCGVTVFVSSPNEFPKPLTHRSQHSLRCRRSSERCLLRRDQRFQRYTIRNHKCGTNLLDQALLLESCEQAAHSLARSTDHLPDFLMGERHFHPAGISTFRVMVEPTHHQTSQLFAGRIRKNQITDFSACARIIQTYLLRHPQGKFAVQAHEPQQIAVAKKTDLAWFLGLGSRLVIARRNYRGHSQHYSRFDHSQDQRSAFAAADRKFHSAFAHDKNSARRLIFAEQNCSRGIGGGQSFVLDRLGYCRWKGRKRRVY